ncbi:hypothetical protein LQ940_00070 [Nocardioides sp. cx-173]|nr:hypothetical protein [Nocardioides sp. cx-173]UGB41950.1 hypothetical protein LQ940_00070 [Nocardioides sp. cx-173]
MTFGNAFKSTDFSTRASDIRLLRGDNVAQGRLRWDGAKRFPATRLAEVVRYELRAGDVVIAMDRPWIAAGLKYAVVRESDLPCLLVQRVARLRAKGALDQGYLVALIGSRAFTDYVVGVQTGSAVPHISGGQIADFTLPSLPTLKEQRAIAATLGALDDKVESNRRAIDLLRRLAVASLRGAAREQRRVSDVAEVRKGLSYKGAGLTDSVSGLPMVNMGSAANFGWLKRTGFKYYKGEYKPRHIAPAGSLVVTGVEQTWRHEIIGWPLLVPSDVGDVLFTHHMLLVTFAPEHDWMRLPLWAHLYSPAARAKLESTIHGTTVATLPAGALSDLSFTVPSRESSAIAAADAMVRRAWALETESEHLSALRDTLLPELLSGRIRVPETVDVVQDVLNESESA